MLIAKENKTMILEYSSLWLIKLNKANNLFGDSPFGFPFELFLKTEDL